MTEITKEERTLETNKIIIYQADGSIKINVRLEQDTVWLTQSQIAKVFGKDKTVITRHINNILKEKELEEAVCANFAHTATDGKIYETKYYNLDMIILVGYRVNSKQGIQFRRWASNILKEYLIKGYSIDRDKIVGEKLSELTQTVKLLSKTLISQDLVTDTGKQLLELINAYSKTWELLIKYDEDNIDLPSKLHNLNEEILFYGEAKSAINSLKNELEKQKQATNLFGLERDSGLASILGNIEQTYNNS